ncbi:MAG: chromosomal replication initiator protein DnaA [Bradymonadaceae bacterium]
MADIWQSILDELEEKVRTETFDTWFEHKIDFRRCDEDRLVLAVEDEFSKVWIEENYLDLIVESLRGVTDGAGGVEIVVDAEPGDGGDDGVNVVEGPSRSIAALDGRPPSEPGTDASDETVEPDERVRRAGLNPRYTFDNFVVGSSNQFVHAACLAVANKPAESYNPLFIFGEVGLGKTHLLQAVGNKLMHDDRSLRVVNRSSEDFMNEVITSIRQESMNEFRTTYRNQCDVLLIDDIQSIAGKDATQKEFFHTFNALYNSGKQIVITSDQPPKELPGIEERLASRFAWGLCADIQPPEMETRVAILEKKAESENIDLDDDVALLLAKHIRSNIRELEGTLVRLGAQAELTDRSITVEMARNMLERMNIEHDRELSVERIIEIVADHFDIGPADIKGSRRTHAISKPRQYAMYLARKHTEHSYPELGRKFGGKDHTTVLAACQKLEEKVEQEPEMAELMETLEEKFYG